MKNIKFHHLKSIDIALSSLGAVIFLTVVKFFVHRFSLEFFTINTLTGSAIAGGVFICSFLLSGVISDYKEAEKIPADLRSSLENIWEEGVFFHRKNNKFKIDNLRKRIKSIIQSFFLGLSHNKGHSNLKDCLSDVDKLSLSLQEMEDMKMLPNFLVRLKTEIGNIRKNILRVYHIQKTQFIPSAFFLGISIVFLIIFILLFVKTEGSLESMIIFGLISYMFIYIVNLIAVIEQPYREGDATRDDISLFLLHELDEKLENNGV